MKRARTRSAPLVAALSLVVAACSSGSSISSSISPPSTITAAVPSGSVPTSGLVDIGGGRKVFATCRGTGSPTVVLISGKGNGAEDWQQILEPGDPVHGTPGDDVSVGMGKIVTSEESVFSSVARFTRVCTYDRPDVRVDAADSSTPRAQPHTVDLDVDDLHALLGALGEPGPYVLVAHSYGGFVATLYARTHPSEVAGLVMVDPGSAEMERVVTKAQLENWDATNAATSPQSREGVKLVDAIRQVDAAGPMPKVPVVVLSADKPWRTDLVPPEAVSPDAVTFANWLESIDRLTTALQAQRVAKTNSGHNIYLYAPRLVVDAVQGIVDGVRAGRPPITR